MEGLPWAGLSLPPPPCAVPTVTHARVLYAARGPGVGAQRGSVGTGPAELAEPEVLLGISARGVKVPFYREAQTEAARKEQNQTKHSSFSKIYLPSKSIEEVTTTLPHATVSSRLRHTRTHAPRVLPPWAPRAPLGL